MSGFHEMTELYAIGDESGLHLMTERYANVCGLAYEA